ncbi:hypothetical protein TNCV_1654141 [Trichonephila clavipes]|nr:hypothetical protein TNCV_1654141 [Trichonephila clavipes]
MLYASPIWAGAAVTHLKRLHTFQNIKLRRAASAPWNEETKSCIKILMFRRFLNSSKNNQKISSTGYHRFQMNLSIREIPAYDNSIPSSSKRPRAVLNHSYQHFPALKRMRMS